LASRDQWFSMKVTGTMCYTLRQVQLGLVRWKKKKKPVFFSYSGCFHFLCRLFSNGFFTTISNFKLTFSDFFFRGSCTKMNDCYV
jgi:hypothetical protein